MNITSCSIFLKEFSDTGILSIAYYSHLVPIVIALFLGFFTLKKTNSSKLSVVFCLFTMAFSLWLFGDLITWTTASYGPIIFVWSWLDYLNIVFFALGTYFFVLLARDGLSSFEKIIMLLVCAPAFLLSIGGYSVGDFYQPACEVIEDTAITNYKLFAEGIFVLMLLYSLIWGWIRFSGPKRVQLVVVASAILLFFASFSLTEYVATITNVYEINLYGLFVLPLFLIVMVFAITNLGIFKARFLGTQLLVYTLIIMVASQFLFLQSSTDAALNIITLVVSIFFGLILLRNTKNEVASLLKIEKLAGDLKVMNERLRDLDHQKTEFVSFASHQLRGPLTPIKGYAEAIITGDYGGVSEEVRKAAQIIFDSTKTLTRVVDDYLNVTRIELGQLKFDFSNFDFKDLVIAVIDEMKPSVKERGLELNFHADPNQKFQINGDRERLKNQVIMNLIDNSVKYTPKGEITISLAVVDGKIQFSVKDTGIGIAPNVMTSLFNKFKRAKNANKTNIHGTGLGLYIAREVVTAHKGRIWAKSDGEGRGSEFVVELPVI